MVELGLAAKAKEEAVTGVVGLVTGLWIVVAIGAEVFAQAASPDPKGRCAQLLAFWDRYGVRRCEGSGGPGMTRLAAGIACDKGRYDSGIKAMEGLIRQNGFSVPPP